MTVQELIDQLNTFKKTVPVRAFILDTAILGDIEYVLMGGPPLNEDDGYEVVLGVRERRSKHD